MGTINTIAIIILSIATIIQSRQIIKMYELLEAIEEVLTKNEE